MQVELRYKRIQGNYDIVNNWTKINYKIKICSKIMCCKNYLHNGIHHLPSQRKPFSRAQATHLATITNPLPKLTQFQLWCSLLPAPCSLLPAPCASWSIKYFNWCKILKKYHNVAKLVPHDNQWCCFLNECKKKFSFIFFEFCWINFLMYYFFIRN